MSVNPYGDAADQLLAQFLAWERRGRGWDVYPYPVELEPPFQPFERYIRVPAQVDDGRRSLLSVLTFGLAGPRASAPVEPQPEGEPTAWPAAAGSVRELHLLLPDAYDSGRETGSLLRACQACGGPVSFELIGQAGVVSLQLVCSPQDFPGLSRNLQSIAPEAALLPRDGFLAAAWQDIGHASLIVDVGLSEEFMRPLRLSDRDGDPFLEVIGALAEADDAELSLLQVIVTPARRPWPTQILRALTDDEGQPFFRAQTDLFTQAREKTKSQLFACRLRLAAKANTRNRTLDLVRAALASLEQFSAPPHGNSLIALDQEGWEAEAQETDLLGRVAHRSGMLLSARELAGLVHLPGRATTATALERARQRTKAMPVSVLGQELVLGDNLHLGKRQTAALSPEQRSRHLYVIGGTGTGKSTLLVNLIAQDLQAGHGVAVLDPHGDLADAVLARVPAHRVNDVVVVDPSDADFPVGINVLAAHSEVERTLLTSDLVALFRRHSTSWGDQMNAVFANAILAFVESSQGGTLPDLRRFLVEKDYRAAFLRTVADSEVVYYWEKQYPLLRGNPQAPILTRLDSFLRPKLVRHIVDARTASLDFRSIMDEQKVLVVKLPQGAIGEENAYLLGSIIIAKFQQIALSRQDVEASARPPFYLYIDEVQEFATPSMATLLSGVRKYGLGLTLSHQNLSQLPAQLMESVFANAGTRICFRVSEQDARKLAEGFSFFQASDLSNLDTGQAICRVGRSEADFNLTTYPGPALEYAPAQERLLLVRAASRRQYARHLPEATPPSQLPAPIPAAEITSTPLTVTPPARHKGRPRTEPVSPGRGGQQHQYLQSLVRRLGQDRGFRAIVEQSILDGIGSVDVALEREGLKVACEIWVTTPLDNEIKNIQKCLAAGFDQVVAISTNAKSLKRLQAAVVVGVQEADRGRIHLVTPDQLPQLLDGLAPPPEQTEIVGGYKVKVQYGSASDQEKDVRSRTLHDVVARTLKRLGGG